jgi:hypothetical protein
MPVIQEESAVITCSGAAALTLGWTAENKNGVVALFTYFCG